MAKKVLLIIIIIQMLIVTAIADTSEYNDVDSMWELVSPYSPNDYITAAIVGHIDFESNCLSDAVGGGYLTQYNGIPDYDTYVTSLIDEGLSDGSTRDEFTKHLVGGYPCWGYGLIQWVDPIECGKLYDFAAEKGMSIGDAEMQVEFIITNTKENFPEIWQKLLDAESAADAGRIFAHFIGGTSLADKLEDRAWRAEELIKEYGDN